MRVGRLAWASSQSRHAACAATGKEYPHRKCCLYTRNMQTSLEVHTKCVLQFCSIWYTSRSTYIASRGPGSTSVPRHTAWRRHSKRTLAQTKTRLDPSTHPFLRGFTKKYTCVNAHGVLAGLVSLPHQLALLSTD